MTELVSAAIRPVKTEGAIVDALEQFREVGNSPGDQMHDASFPLDGAVDEEHAGEEDDGARLVEEVWPDDESGDAGLVLDNDEGDAVAGIGLPSAGTTSLSAALFTLAAPWFLGSSKFRD